MSQSHGWLTSTSFKIRLRRFHFIDLEDQISCLLWSERNPHSDAQEK